MNKPRSLDTKVVHSGEPSPRIAGAIALPIFQSSTFEYQENAAYHDIRYIRLNNTPNHSALHKKIADLESAEAAVVTSSVMAAISTTLLTILKTGDHLLAQNCLYGGTMSLILQDLLPLGITVDFIDAADPRAWKEKVNKNTRVIYVEAMTGEKRRR